MTDPLTQAQADAEQVRLVREALALRRDRPAGEGTPQALRFFPGGPRPTLAEPREHARIPPAAVIQPEAREAQPLAHLPQHGGQGGEGPKPALR